MLTTVYYSHFVVALSIAGLLWVRNRASWVRFMRRYLSLNILALVVYITYPMAPPWLASQDGFITGDISRITGRGWHDLRDGDFHQKLSAVGNPVAAMPSLHAGVALLVAVYGISRLRGAGAGCCCSIRLAMSFMLVYYAEHYVVDILAGFAAAGLVLWGCARGSAEVPSNRPGIATAPRGDMQSANPRSARYSSARSAWTSPGSGIVACRLLGADHVHDRVDQRQVGERLREVAQVPPAARVDLLGVELERAGVGEQPLAQLAGRARARRSRPGPTPARTSRW